MKYAGQNTVSAIMENIKGDMSKLTNVLVPSFAEVYENFEVLDKEKEDVFIKITKANFDLLTQEEKESNNYIVTDDDSGGIVFDFVTASDVEAWFE